LKRYRFLEEAEAEFQDAIAYLDGQSAGLGDDFIDDLESAVGHVLQYPESGSPVARHVRKWALRRFPYNLLYVVEPDEVLVLAIAAHKRRPNYWRKRLPLIRTKGGKNL
jgi:toxin ParE1/3/4